MIGIRRVHSQQMKGCLETRCLSRKQLDETTGSPDSLLSFPDFAKCSLSMLVQDAARMTCVRILTLRACSLLSPSAICAASRHPSDFHSNLLFPTCSASCRSPPWKQLLLQCPCSTPTRNRDAQCLLSEAFYLGRSHRSGGSHTEIRLLHEHGTACRRASNMRSSACNVQYREHQTVRGLPPSAP